MYAMLGYANVNAQLPSASLQERCNAISKSPAQAAMMLECIPGLGSLARGALAALGVSGPQLETSWSAPDCVHLFLLTADNQMSYGWHADDTDLVNLIQKRSLGTISARERMCEGIRSVVVQLSPTAQTAMVLWSFEKALYRGQGAAKAFHGTCLHASVPWEQNSLARPVWKVSMFWTTSSLGLLPDQFST